MTTCKRCKGLGSRIECPVPCTQDMMIGEVWDCEFFRPLTEADVAERIERSWSEEDYTAEQKGYMTRWGRKSDYDAE